ncbi:MAG: hypothetical protein F7B20_05200 [Aeropyrum sp.]|nr:hypothetical protein [Aeropyrum sp.]MCE4616588.1 hypothetical protein [Aeropyrum sp.]
MIKKSTLRKAELMLPENVEVEKIYIAVKMLKGTSSENDDVITPSHIEA